MGSFFSTAARPDEEAADPEYLPPTDLQSPLLHREAAEDAHSWYEDFFDKAYCVPHADGKNIIICYPSDESYGKSSFVPNPREEEGWGVDKVRRVYERLSEGEGCQRIVKYTRTLQDGSVLVEKLAPGPLDALTLPILTLAFLHSHNINIKFFSSKTVWLRSDYSLAITGFISAVIDHQEDDYGEDGGWAGNEAIMFDDSVESIRGSVKEDLFYWATFVWRLLTNDHTSSAHWKHGEMWEPVLPLEGGPPKTDPDVYKILAERHQASLFQELEEERLGPLLVAVWKGQYESVEEVKEEVKRMASKVGIELVGDDEVDVGEA
ncbi:hypothetical protein BDV96DRAFT_498756 [Lophiotrema nucula]|uniref:Uncharacterized protein n=1 Tax=Lophiotrema nucula TaxID=690887 RepID=A0A6A5Z0F9_9PLEO|nr:hypothetical protein BDV96DRAFT_498756 [Lophiotrema nucula]